MSLKKSVRRLVAWLERGTKRWLFIRGASKPLGHEAHRKIRKNFITETTHSKIEQPVTVVILRRIEVWRPVKNLTAFEFKDAKAFAMINGIEKALIDVDEDTISHDDMVVDGGLNDLCAKGFGTQTAVFNYVAIGTDSTAPASGQTTLGAEVMRVQGTYAKDAGVGECSMDATFNITATYALNECGLLNAASAGTLYCRDTYTTKNVVSGDTVKAFEERPRMRPKFIIRRSSKDLLRELSNIAKFDNCHLPKLWT